MEWYPTEEIWAHGQLDIFWVLPLPKVYSSQGVILFIKCQRVEFLCKLKTELAGQKKANKNCMKFGVGWGWVASFPADLAFTAWKRKLNLSKLCVYLEKLIWQKINLLYEGKFMRLQRPEKPTISVFFKEGNVKNSNCHFSLCSFKICLMPILYSDILGTGKHI